MNISAKNHKKKFLGKTASFFGTTYTFCSKISKMKASLGGMLSRDINLCRRVVRGSGNTNHLVYAGNEEPMGDK